MLTEHQLTFWREVYRRLGHDTFVAGGHAYSIALDRPNVDPATKGFGGAKFEVHFFSGSVVYTGNLWHRGTVPEELRPYFPDTAKLHNGEGAELEWVQQDGYWYMQKVYRCTLCHENVVDADNSFDTCDSCLARM